MKDAMKERLLCVVLLFTGSVFAGDAKPPEVKGPQTRTVRILGLCTPERENDLRESVAKHPNVKLDGINYARSEATFSYDTKVFGHDSLPHVIGSKGFGVKTTPRPPDDKLVTLEIPIQILDCAACCLGTYNSISKIDGLEQANVDRKGKVVAVIDPSKTNREALVKAMRNAGAEVAKSPEELAKDAQEKAAKEAKEKEAKEKEKEKAK
jgi:hypothetical protein